MLQISREACWKTCWFSRLLFYAESHPRAAAREAQLTVRFSPINSCLDAVLQDCAQHMFICWYVVASVFHLPRFSPSTQPSLPSLRLPGEWRPYEKGGKRGGAVLMEWGSGCGLRFTSVLRVGLKICRENAPQIRHRQEWKKSFLKTHKCQSFLRDFWCARRAGRSQMLTGYW